MGRVPLCAAAPVSAALRPRMGSRPAGGPAAGVRHGIMAVSQKPAGEETP